MVDQLGNPYLFFIGPPHHDLFFSLSYILYLVNRYYLLILFGSLLGVELMYLIVNLIIVLICLLIKPTGESRYL